MGTAGIDWCITLFSIVFERNFFQGLLFSVAVHISLRHITAKFDKNGFLWLYDMPS